MLVAGVGNVFLGDDGFGVEVARRLAGQETRPGVTIADFGIRGLHLAHELLEGYDALILIDALARGNPPGTLCVLEPGETEPSPGSVLDAHGLDPASVLAMVRLLGGTIRRTLLVGCEPADLGEKIGLSPPVERAVDEAVRLVHRLIEAQLGGDPCSSD